MAGPTNARLSDGVTAWARTLGTPLRDFLRTETGGAMVLAGAVVAALLWANIDSSSYDSVWGTELSIRLGDHAITSDLREWVNEGLMAFFFFVVGLEARREFDLGELRERNRLALPVIVALGGMALPVAIFLAFNAGEPSADGWAAAASTDTAFALGVLALFGPRLTNRLRAFMVSVVVVDDVVALLIIATAYTHDLEIVPLLIGAGFFGLVLAARYAGIRVGLVYLALGVATWVALRESGVDPIIVGLAMGLITYAYPAGRDDLERATERFRLFREQPTPELAREATQGVAAAISPNDRLQQRFHPWSSYGIVPLFALANAGIVLEADLIERAVTSPITLGIALGYVAGKPVGILGASALARAISRGRIQIPIGWGAVAGVGTAAGIGFTVSILIASRAFTGDELDEAKIAVLAAAVLSSLLTWIIFRTIHSLPAERKATLMLGSADEVLDLSLPVEPEHDHIRGPEEAPVTLVEYGDFECPYCGRAEPIVRQLLSDFGDVRYVWRHLPLADVHARAQMAAEAAEAAGRQGKFWDMHDLLLEHQDALRPQDLMEYAAELGLDTDRFRHDLREHTGAARVARDVDSADLSGVSGTPTFFINGRRHHGAYDIDHLSAAVRAARAKALAQESKAA